MSARIISEIFTSTTAGTKKQLKATQWLLSISSMNCRFIKMQVQTQGVLFPPISVNLKM